VGVSQDGGVEGFCLVLCIRNFLVPANFF
jgi:hypothetical protein